ncbi:MAG: RAMP superfamily CRISPR-associated protein, partial [Epsilonproteobacteria bacterium]|nr:RAMP superfamily CRISPR-associated protein [Campylobacterota bacterium]
MENNYNKRYIANIVFEANTPLKVGSSDLDMLQDSPVQKDWNELPMILGTSIAGVLRKEFDTTFASDIFGDEKGSRVIISNALLCDEDMQVIEILNPNKNDFLKIFENLPQREHTKITEK